MAVRDRNEFDDFIGTYFIVTGGGTGMGRDIALELSRRGAQVLVVGRRQAPLVETCACAPGNVTPLAADMSSTDGVRALEAALAERPVSGVVLAAGGQGEFYAEGSADPAEVRQRWDAAFQKNFFSALLPTQMLLQHLDDMRGRILFISSTSALDGRGGPYAAAKAALHGYCLSLAQQLGPRGITVNTIAPGFVADTGFFEAAGFGSAAPMIPAAAAGTLVGRVGRPADVTAMAVALLSAGAGWTTAQFISVNGGSVLGR